MKHKGIIGNRWQGIGLAAAVSLALAAAGHAAIVDSVETFAVGPAGWEHYDLINHDPVVMAPGDAYEEGALKIAYRTRTSLYSPTSPTTPKEILVRAFSSASGGAFVGNILSEGARGFSFKLFASHDAFVRVLLRGANGGGWWEFLVPVSQPGVWTTVYVPFRASYWYNQLGSSDKTTLERDLGDVEWVGVAVQQGNSMDAQVFHVDDFVLMGEDPLFVEWMAQYDDGSGEKMGPEDDHDGDGVSNHDEWIAGTSADNDEQYLTLRADKDTGHFTLNWASVAKKKYQVFRSVDLKLGFTPIGPVQDADPPENEYRDTTATNGAVYYKIEVWDPTLAE